MTEITQNGEKLIEEHRTRKGGDREACSLQTIVN